MTNYMKKFALAVTCALGVGGLMGCGANYGIERIDFSDVKDTPVDTVSMLLFLGEDRARSFEEQSENRINGIIGIHAFPNVDGLYELKISADSVMECFQKASNIRSYDVGTVTTRPFVCESNNYTVATGEVNEVGQYFRRSLPQLN